MGFEERFSNLLDRGKRKPASPEVIQAADSADPIGGNRFANFVPFPTATDVSNITAPKVRGITHFPGLGVSVFNNNSPLPLSAKPDQGTGFRMTETALPPGIARGTVENTPAPGVARWVRGRFTFWRERARRIIKL